MLVRAPLTLRELHPLTNPELTTEALIPTYVLRLQRREWSLRPEGRVPWG